jgi:hypothetical protein
MCRTSVPCGSRRPTHTIFTQSARVVAYDLRSYASSPRVLLLILCARFATASYIFSLPYMHTWYELGRYLVCTYERPQNFFIMTTLNVTYVRSLRCYFDMLTYLTCFLILAWGSLLSSRSSYVFFRSSYFEPVMCSDVLYYRIRL